MQIEDINQVFKRLRLHDGDIVVVSDQSVMQALREMRYRAPLDVTFIWAPNGLHKLSRKEATAILEQLSTTGDSDLVVGNPIK